MSSRSIFKTLGKPESLVASSAGESLDTAVVSSNNPVVSSSEQKEMKNEFACDLITNVLMRKLSDKDDYATHVFRGYTASISLADPKTKDFIYFTNDEYTRERILTKYEKNPEGVVSSVLGLKFHISLLEDNGAQRLKAWEIICDICIKNKINSFKIIKHGEKMSRDPEQRGKDITIYANLNPNLNPNLDINDWTHILQLITQELVNEKIPPGFRPLDSKENPEKPINGSNYIAYRYEDESIPSARLANRQLLKRMKIDLFVDKYDWPLDKKNDLGANIKVKVAGQLDIPKYQEANAITQGLEAVHLSASVKK